MARNQRSSVLFNIDIKGVQSAEQLTRTLPKLIKQFRDLAKAIDKVNEAEQKAGRGSKSGGITRGDVSDSISRVKLGIRKGDIQSVQQLSGHYGQLVSQINKLERAGENVNSLRLRAFELYKRERAEIEKTIQSKRQNNQATLAAASSTDGFRNSLLNNIETMNLSKQTMQQVERHTQRVADAQKNASYVILNAGYLIQDSPYGIRGMANNLSQLAQSYQMLRERVEFLNRTQNANLTVWKSMKSLMMGPTGWILLLGSVLPAALEILNSKWDDWFGTQKDTNEEIEKSIDLINSFVQAQRSIRGGIGEDPLGILGMRQDIESLENILADLQIVKQARDDLDSVAEGIRGIEQAAPGFGAAVREHYSAPLEIASGIVETLERRFGALSDVELDQLTDKISEMRAELILNQDLLRRDPALLAQQQTGQIIAQMEQELQIFSEAGMSKAEEEVRQRAEVMEGIWTASLKHFIETGQMGLASAYSSALENLRKVAEEEKDKTEDDLIEIGDFDIEEGIQALQSRFSDMNELALFRAEQQVEIAESTAEKIEAVRNASAVRLEEIERARQNNEFNSYEDYLLQKEKIAAETEERIQKIRDNAAKQEEQRLKEQQQQEELYQNRRMQIISNYSQFAIQSGRAIANAVGQSAKEQFVINKIASASQAVINGRLAYTKTLAMGGILAKPLAISALALSLGQAAAIMSQSYDSAISTGSAGGTVIGYRGLDFAQSQTAQYSPFTGRSESDREMARPNSTFPSKVKAEFTDGFGNVVSKGTLQLQQENKDDLGYWKET